MLGICYQLFSLWETNNVHYCHWKSNEHLMEGLVGDTDLDVFVCASDKQLAESLLSQCGYLECQPQKGHRYPNVFEWIGFDSKTGKLVHVHLHYQIITGTKFCKEYVFPVDDIIIATRIKDDTTGVYIADPNLEIIILHSRIALKARNKRNIHLDDNNDKEVRYLRERIESEKVLSYCRQLIPNNGEELYNYIITGNISVACWYRIYQIVEQWLRPYRKYSKSRVFFQFNYFDKRNYFVIKLNSRFNSLYINQKVFKKRQLSICFLGQDGSGKSTVTKELCKWLNWKIEARRFYLGSGDHYNGLLKRIIKKTQKVSNNVNKPSKQDNEIQINQKTTKKKKNLKNFFSAFLVAYNYLTVARRAYREVLKAEKYRQRGGIPLYDRFPQVQFKGVYDGPKIEYSFEKSGLDYRIIRRMAVKEENYLLRIQQFQPQLVFKLILSPQESIRRKPFEDLEAVTRKHEITKQIKFDKAIVYTIDATQDYQQEILSIKNEIWRVLLQNK